MSINRILITGANSGLGKEAARQLALAGTRHIILGCRNPEKAAAAKGELEASTGKAVFETLHIDVASPASVRHALSELADPVDALIMNAGGMGGPAPLALTDNGVTNQFAVNVLGHALLLETLLEQGKITQTAR